jgi:hypothetical protein
VSDHTPHAPVDTLKIFAMNNLLLEHDLDRIETQYSLDLGRGNKQTAATDNAYYPQIDQVIRAEAARMATHYEMFYSLETTIRQLVAETIEAAEGDLWWEQTKRVPTRIASEVTDRIQREKDSGVTPRSQEPIDFTTFGELSELIKQNWDLFGSIFSSIKAVERVMANLNTLRGPIAHCSPLAEDEVVRLRLSVRDWFRLME